MDKLYNILRARLPGVDVDQRPAELFARDPEPVVLVLDRAGFQVDAEEGLDLAPAQQPLGAGEPAEDLGGVLALGLGRLFEYPNGHSFVAALVSIWGVSEVD